MDVDKKSDLETSFEDFISFDNLLDSMIAPAELRLQVLDWNKVVLLK